MEKALRRMISKIIIPKYRDIDLNFNISKHYSGHGKRYMISFSIRNSINLNKDIEKSLEEDIKSLIMAFGFYDIVYSDYAHIGTIYVLGSYS